MSCATALHRSASLLAAVALGLFAASCGDEETETTTTTATHTVTDQTTTTETTTETETTADGAEPQPRSCGDVAFEPQTDAGAFDIHATGTSCDVARAVAAAADGAGAEYSARGFTCEGAESGQELPGLDFTCRGDGAVVTFTAS